MQRSFCLILLENADEFLNWVRVVVMFLTSITIYRNLMSIQQSSIFILLEQL